MMNPLALILCGSILLYFLTDLTTAIVVAVILLGIYFYLDEQKTKKQIDALIQAEAETKRLLLLKADPSTQLPELIQLTEKTLTQESQTQNISTEHRKFYLEEIKHRINNAREHFGANNFSLACHYIGLALQDSALIRYLDAKSYLKPLARQYDQLKFQDTYGDHCLDAVKAEITNFCSKRISEIVAVANQEIESRKQIIELAKNLRFKHQNSNETFSLQSLYEKADIFSLETNHTKDRMQQISEMIFNIVEGYALSESYFESNNNLALDEIETGVDYEKAVAELFKDLGWKAKTTKGSGDQGADVIAEKNGVTLIAQCKYYSSNVGNGAVQEAHSAKGFYRTNYAAVVSNAGFTKSARQLAESLDVYLVHHNELEDLDSMLFQH